MQWVDCNSASRCNPPTTTSKKKSKKGKKGYIPRFEQTSNNLNSNENIIFGHWASLEGKTGIKNIIGLDTGCVWGNKLTAIRLEDKKLFQVKKK